MTPSTAGLSGVLGDFALRQATESLESGDFPEAIEWLERAPQSPESRMIEAQARYRLANEMISNRRFDDAETQLGRIPKNTFINQHLINERIRLVRRRRVTTSELQEMTERFDDVCDSCRGRDLYTRATCVHRPSSVPPARKLLVGQFAPVIEGSYAAAAYRSSWDRLRADPMSQLLRLEKKALVLPAVRSMGILLGSYVCHHTPLVEAVDVLVPIPTSGSRAEARGGCIPKELAESIRDEMAIPIIEAIKTKGDYEGHQQVQGSAREEELRRAWVVEEDPVLRDRTVAVVDDIITTGTTMMTAARLLREKGVGRVFALSLFHAESSQSAK